MKYIFWCLIFENNLIFRTFLRNLIMQVLDWLRFETSFQAMSLYTKTKPWSLLSTENFFFLEGDERPTKKSRRNELKVKEEENVNSHKNHLPTVLVTKLVFKKNTKSQGKKHEFLTVMIYFIFWKCIFEFWSEDLLVFHGKIFFHRFEIKDPDSPDFVD